MKRIVLSLAIIAVVAVAAVGATRAFFSDTETSTGNTISAGTIDISVDGQNPWEKNYTQDLTDLKPGVTKYIEFTVKNNGENPIVLRKQIGNFQVDVSAMNEPKCSALGGELVNNICSVTPPVNFDTKMVYDMTVTPEGGSPIVVINESWGVTMSDVKDLWVPLGTVEPGKTLVVKQSYKLDSATDNKYQGDKLTFDISLYAEQKDGPGPSTTNGLVMDNKEEVNWYSVVDGNLGLLTWDGSGNYKFKAWGVNNAMTYNLVYWNGSAEVVIGGPLTPSAGVVTNNGTYAAFNTNSNAKYWLRPTPWSSSSNANTLWEGNLVRQP